MEMLRFATAGSVDDGKSTLIGRLLLDSKQIFEDQLEAVERTSRDRGFDYTNLALLTDGLRAEREQGITIDVAYRYFATPKRKFIIADTPGHVQYTRNMVTGASTADLALVLVDARKGMTEQSRRHAVIASLLQVKHLAVCVNKMDLVEFDEKVFEEIRAEFTEFAGKLEFADLTFIPISALLGDNVIEHSPNTPWYGGPTLLWHLENLYIGSDRNLIDPRFPVQYVIRPMSNDHHDYRGYAGQVAGGQFRAGDEVLVLPSGFMSTVAAVEQFGGTIDEASAGMSVTVRLSDEIDISRGDLLCRPHNAPTVSQDIEAMVCWFSEKPLSPRTTYAIKHTTRSARCMVRDLSYRLDINTLHRDDEAGRLAMNDIGRVTLRTTAPLFFDEYRRNRHTGSFILIDEGTNETVAGGMILGEASTIP
jgi:bifunctional enzyme CysN/CysC